MSFFKVSEGQFYKNTAYHKKWLRTRNYFPEGQEKSAWFRDVSKFKGVVHCSILRIFTACMDNTLNGVILKPLQERLSTQPTHSCLNPVTFFDGREVSASWVYVKGFDGRRARHEWKLVPSRIYDHINSGNTFFHSARDPLSPRFLSKNANTKSYKTAVLRLVKLSLWP